MHVPGITQAVGRLDRGEFRAEVRGRGWNAVDDSSGFPWVMLLSEAVNASKPGY